jgi:hypothetical protein
VTRPATAHAEPAVRQEAARGRAVAVSSILLFLFLTVLIFSFKKIFNVFVKAIL